MYKVVFFYIVQKKAFYQIIACTVQFDAVVCEGVSVVTCTAFFEDRGGA